MTIEKIKTVVLILLVISSSLLTWTIWTYQPKYRTLEDEKVVQQVSLSGHERHADKIIFPDKVFCHYGSEYYGTIDSVQIEKIMKEISRWGFDKFEEVSGLFDNIDAFIYKNGNMEIVYPAQVPMKIFRTFAEVKDKDASGIQFDRIIIETANMTKTHGHIYFISLENHSAYQAEVPASLVTNFRQDYYPSANSEHFSRYRLVDLNNGRKLPIRATGTKMHRYSYLMDSLPTEDFKNALFSDPHFVKRNVTSSGEEYYDESTLMSINFRAHMLHYVNPAQTKGSSIEMERLLGQSIDFVNGHGGWTGNYRYVDIDTFEKTTLFRMYDSFGYPIFSSNGISEIYLSWGETGVNQYMRNNFSFGGIVEKEEVWMPSGMDIYNSLISREGFQPEYLQDLALGYKMTSNSEGTLLYLEPAWYYKYRDQWVIFPSGSGGR